MIYTAVITIGIPTNGTRLPHLKHTIESLIGQTFKDWYAVVIDNGADPGKTRDLVESFREPRLTFLELPAEMGVINKFNKVFEIADTEFCAVMHDDDWYHHEYLAEMISGMKQHQSAGWAFCNSFLVKESTGGQTTVLPVSSEVSMLEHGSGFIHSLLAQTYRIIMPSVMFRKNVYKSEKFDPYFLALVDFQMWLRLAAKYDSVYIGRPLFYYNCWEGNASHDLARSGGMLADAIRMLDWFNEQPEYRQYRDEFKSYRPAIITTHCKIIIWHALTGAKQDHGRVLNILDGESGFIVGCTRFLLRHAVILAVGGVVVRKIRLLVKRMRGH